METALLKNTLLELFSDFHGIPLPDMTREDLRYVPDVYYQICTV